MEFASPHPRVRARWAFVIAASLCGASGGSASDAFPYPLETAVLDNGLRVAVSRTGDGGMFSLYEVVGVGSRDEIEPGHSGFAHFFEHMMFRGTKSYPPEKRGALLSSLGLDEGGYTTDDFTTYYVKGPSQGLASVIEIEADRF